MKIIKEFQEFVSRGNVVDLAIGVIIGSAFGKIVTSIVEDIIMPPIGLIIGGVNFTDIKIQLKPGYTDTLGKIIPSVNLNIGNFIQITFNFLIIAFSIFLIVKAMNKLKREQEKKDQKEEKKIAADSKEVLLLTEIRDLLRK